MSPEEARVLYYRRYRAENRERIREVKRLWRERRQDAVCKHQSTFWEKKAQLWEEEHGEIERSRKAE